jgi:hypothetical protein
MKLAGSVLHFSEYRCYSLSSCLIKHMNVIAMFCIMYMFRWITIYIFLCRTGLFDMVLNVDKIRGCIMLLL